MESTPPASSLLYLELSLALAQAGELLSCQDEERAAQPLPLPTLHQEKVQAPCGSSDTCLFVHESSRESWLLLQGFANNSW